MEIIELAYDLMDTLLLPDVSTEFKLTIIMIFLMVVTIAITHEESQRQIKTMTYWKKRDQKSKCIGLHNELSFNANTYSELITKIENGTLGPKYYHFALSSLETCLSEMVIADIDIYVNLKYLHIMMERHNMYLSLTREPVTKQNIEQVQQFIVKEFKRNENMFNKTIEDVGKYINTILPLGQ